MIKTRATPKTNRPTAGLLWSCVWSNYLTRFVLITSKHPIVTTSKQIIISFSGYNQHFYSLTHCSAIYELCYSVVQKCYKTHYYRYYNNSLSQYNFHIFTNTIMNKLKAKMEYYLQSKLIRLHRIMKWLFDIFNGYTVLHVSLWMPPTTAPNTWLYTQRLSPISGTIKSLCILFVSK